MDRGSTVQVNATLVDPKAPIQYAAKLVWNKDDFKSDPNISRRGDEPSPSLLQKYYNANEIAAFAEATIDTITVTPVPVPAAAWLFGSALGLLVYSRRKAWP